MDLQTLWFALIAFFWTGATILSLVLFFSAYMLVDGIFGIVSGMNDCPPKPGSTVMTRIWSKSSSRSNSPSTGVAGLTATPARAPIDRRRRASATGSVAASRWNVTDAAPSSA